MIDLWSIGFVPIMKSVKNKEFGALTNVLGDQWALHINTITDHLVRYAVSGITYKIYFQNREGSTLAIAVFVSHHVVKEGIDYDLCQLLRFQLLHNLTLTKKEGYAFWFGSLAIFMLFYFEQSLSLKENVVWDEFFPIRK